MRRASHTLLVSFALLTTLGVLGGCNTMAGAGKDLQQGGQALTNSADKNGAQQPQQ